MEDINCILNSGEVPDLFDSEERDGIRMDLKQAASEADIPDTQESVYQFFIHRVRQNLHVVLTMSPAGGKFRQRCRMNPALINCCTIDWYDEWDDDAMLNVAQVFFSNAEFITSEGSDIEVSRDDSNVSPVLLIEVQSCRTQYTCTFTFYSRYCLPVNKASAFVSYPS